VREKLLLYIVTISKLVDSVEIYDK
jgi:hypothetical protein